MRINNITNNMYVYNQNNTNKATNKADEVSNKNYDLKISDKGTEYQFALKKAREASDFRAEKVQAIKDKIANGEYNVTSQDVANKMIDDLFIQK